MFLGIFVYQMGDEQILTPLDNISGQAATQMNLSAPIVSALHDLPESYRNLNIPFDLFLLIILISAFTGSVYSAAQTQEMGWWNFFGAITFMLIIFLFISSYLAVVKDWLILNLFVGFLQIDLGTLPIFNWYVTHLGMINFIWGVILITLNKLNFSYNRDTEDTYSGLSSEGGFQK
jgi:hypothetical protein